jgi:hypothetical protein
MVKEAAEEHGVGPMPPAEEAGIEVEADVGPMLPKAKKRKVRRDQRAS